MSLTEVNDRAAKCAEQDQTARMRRLILLYTHRKVYPRLRKARYGLTLINASIDRIVNEKYLYENKSTIRYLPKGSKKKKRL